MLLGAQLAISTKNATFNQIGDTIYRWLKTSGLLTPDWRVWDGVKSESDCALADFEVSYEPGVLIGALAWMSQGSGQTSYIAEASKILTQALSQYSISGVVTDPCEPLLCPLNSVAPKGELLRGMGYLWEFTNDGIVKATIKQSLTLSAAAMIKTCDDNWNCGNNWFSGVPNVGGKSVHDQMNAIQLMTSYYKTFGNPLKKGGNAPIGSGSITTGSGEVAPLPKAAAFSTSLSPIFSFVVFLSVWMIL
jgi:mannan endo-1,6-alpha-mannosidase